MKNQKHFIWSLVLFLGLLIYPVSCNKDNGDTSEPPVDNEEIVVSDGQITGDDFEKFAGELGMVINARNIAKKGYIPTTADISVEATLGDYSQTVDIDPITFMGQVRINVEELTEEALKELEDGVAVTIAITDSDGVMIISNTLSIVVFRSNPTPQELNVTDLEETEAASTIALKEDTSYYMQNVNSNGQPLASALRVNRSTGFSNIMTRTSNPTFSGIEQEPDFVFNFVPFPDEPNTYAIKIQSDGRFFSVANGLNIQGQIVDAPRLSLFDNFDDVLARPNVDNYKFIIRKVSEGVYNIVSKAEERVVRVRSGIGFVVDDNPAYDVVSMRIISSNLEWIAEDIGTTFLAPVLSAPGTDFGANSTLTNCGTGELSQTVGNDKSVEISETVSWEESTSLTTTGTASVSMTVGTEFEAGFFGAKAKYDASVTATASLSVGVTEGSKEIESFTETESETIFFQRTVTVPPGSASLVYDVAQIYDDTKVQFVQRFRLRATESGNPLSGEELRSQLQFSRFSGVVLQVGSDFIDITIKGTLTLGKVLSAKSEVQDVEANCG
ncbi:hypothetical protein [Costertonia aggregata]|uniref:Uncharacterized protein n=1 Tax=Costertonia aggregata TaxID=343403 RepID=A0A7H9ASE1_9FLAO|nr:hypothetical protein [Costertonia aggregata]QLG46398.1 hypothetical protein HYG79_13920 [Costertonia aggregata]